MHWGNCGVVSIVCSVRKAQTQQLINLLQHSPTSVLSLILNIIKFCYYCFVVFWRSVITYHPHIYEQTIS